MAAAWLEEGTQEAVWDHRSKHRNAGVKAVHRSRDYVTMLLLTSTGELSSDDAPTPPDPSDRTLSKRQWEMRMMLWRAALKDFVNSAEA